MAERPRDEGVWSRGRHDASHALRTVKFWVVQIVGLALIAVVAEQATPGRFESAARVAASTGAGLLVMFAIAGVVLLVSVVQAPIRQRDELRAWREGASEPEGDTDAAAVVSRLRAATVGVEGRDADLASVFVALGRDLATGIRSPDLRQLLKQRVAEIGELSESQLASLIADLRIANVITSEHVWVQPGERGGWPVGGSLPHDRYDLTELGGRVLTILETHMGARHSSLRDVAIRPLDSEPRWAHLEARNRGQATDVQVLVELSSGTGREERAYHAPWRDNGEETRRIENGDVAIANIAEISPSGRRRGLSLTDWLRLVFAPDQHVLRFHSTYSTPPYFDRVFPSDTDIQCEISVLSTNTHATSGKYELHVGATGRLRFRRLP